MKELFEFVIHNRDGRISDSFVSDFIKDYLDKNSLYWGGGYDSNKINGVISSEKNSINMTSILKELATYFDHNIEIEVEVFKAWFDKVDFSNLENIRNLKITKSNTVY